MDCLSCARQLANSDPNLTASERGELLSQIETISQLYQCEDWPVQFDQYCNPRKMRGPQATTVHPPHFAVTTKSAFLNKIVDVTHGRVAIRDAETLMEEWSSYAGAKYLVMSYLATFGTAHVQRLPVMPNWITTSAAVKSQSPMRPIPELAAILGLPACRATECVLIKINVSPVTPVVPTTLDPGSGHIPYWMPGGVTKPLAGCTVVNGLPEHLINSVTFADLSSDLCEFMG